MCVQAEYMFFPVGGVTYLFPKVFKVAENSLRIHVIFSMSFLTRLWNKFPIIYSNLCFSFETVVVDEKKTRSRHLGINLAENFFSDF